MYYRNVAVEMARRGMTKAVLTTELNKRDVKISYSTLCRQLRGETDIPFGQAIEMGKILESDPQYLLEEVKR
jgi:glycerol-3-phosphate dehydrogenase